MINNKSIAVVIISIIVTCFSCSKEKIEFEKQHSGSYFNGFASNKNFIIHDESISYYNSNSSEVFGNLFEYQNGRKLGKSVHSLDFFEFENEVYGIITIEGENMIEIIDKNFISVNQISLNSPRNIRVIRDYLNGDKLLVSYGDHNNGGLAYMEAWGIVLGAANNFVEIHDSINTGNSPGSIYIHNNYIYVSSTGTNVHDSTIAKIYFGEGRLQKVEDINLGKRPLILFGYKEGLTGYYNPCLIIQCLRGNNESPKIVYYDLVKSSIFKSFNISDENLPLDILGVNSNLEFIYRSNNKLYQGSLERLDTAKLLSEKNITNLVLKNENFNLVFPREQDSWPNGPIYEVNYYTGFYSRENEDYSILYRFESNMNKDYYFEIIDSLKINKGAKKIADNHFY